MAAVRQNPGLNGLLLFTDLYQLSMAQAYRKAGLAGHEAVFHLGFRRSPFSGGVAVAACLADAIDLLSHLEPSEEDFAYLASFVGNGGRPLFDPVFPDQLRMFRFPWDLDAVAEGTVVFPYEPILRVRGPVIHAQVVETALLNIINFQTLIAAKAARICASAGGDSVIEFRMRRAQGPEGARAASASKSRSWSTDAAPSISRRVTANAPSRKCAHRAL